MKNIFLIFLLIVSASLARAQSGKQETISWYISDFPPTYILSTANQGQGWGDQVIQILMKRLPEFRHEIVETSIGRFIDMIKVRPNVCRANFLKTPERESFMEFSAPLLQTLPNGIITTRKRLALFTPFLNENGELRLDDFLGDGKFRLGIITGRSFGAGIDPVLKKRAGQTSIVVVPSSDQLSSRLLKLVHQNEFDAIVGYAIELRYVTRQLGLNEQDFGFILVSEETPLIPNFVACSKTELGKRVITQINRTLANQNVQREIDAAYRSWLSEEIAARFARSLNQLKPAK